MIASYPAPPKKNRLSAASTRRCTPSLSSALLGTCQPGVCVRCCFFRSHNISRTIRGFPIEPKAVHFHQIESISSRFIKKSRFESIRFIIRSSIIRALTKYPRVMRTHDVHKNPYIPLFLHTILGPDYYLPSHTYYKGTPTQIPSGSSLTTRVSSKGDKR